MKVLQAAQGDQPGDFSWTVPGELLYIGPVCAQDDAGGDGCGCGRSFTGLATGKSTTVALVAETDVDLDGLTELLRTHLLDGGWSGVDQWAAELARDVADEAGAWALGTLLRRNLDEVAPV